MEEHARLAHPSMPPLNQKCPHCGFVVLSATALSRHAKTHHLATVQCGACTRVHQRFERHGSGEMWPEEVSAPNSPTLSILRVLDSSPLAEYRRRW